MKVLFFLLFIGCAGAQKECSDKKFTSCGHKQKEFPAMYDIGEWNYCSERYGYLLGKSGVARLEECPDHLRANFFKGYTKGREEHSRLHFKEEQDAIKKGI